MLRPYCDIYIGDNLFDFVTEASFELTWRELTDRGEMTLPHKFKKDGKTIYLGENNLFKKGDFVEVFAGYFPNKGKIFEGYLSKIKPAIPVELNFEDASWLLKQQNLTVSFPKITLSELINECLKLAKEQATGLLLEGLNKIVLNVVDASLGVFRLTNVNIAQVLEELRKTYALRSYFLGHELVIGLAYRAGRNPYTFTFEEDIIEDDLEYIKEDELVFKVKAISMLEDNTKIEVEVGDPHGDQRTITKYNLNEKDLKEVALREIERLRYEGFRGSFRTFLDWELGHGDEVEIIDPNRSERNGIYLVEKVTKEIGVNGYFMEVKLGIRVDVSQGASDGFFQTITSQE